MNYPTHCHSCVQTMMWCSLMIHGFSANFQSKKINSIRGNLWQNKHPDSPLPVSGIIPSQLYCNHIQLAEWQSSLHCFGGEEMCHLTFCMFSGDKLAPSSLSSCQCFPFHPTPFPKFLFPVFLWLSGQIFREQSMGGKTQPYWLPSPGRDCDPIKGIHSHILGDGVVVEGLRLRLNFFYRLWMLHSHQCTV